MSQADLSVAPSAFLAGLLEREGALCDLRTDGAVEALLPSTLQGETGLPESARLRVVGEAGPQEVAVPLESAAMRWCVERARSRGRIAAARIPHARLRSQGLTDAILGRISSSNASLRPAGTQVRHLRQWLVELRWRAVGDERVEGSLHVCVEPKLRLLSAPLAEALLGEIGGAIPERASVDPLQLSALLLRSEDHLRRLVAARLAPLRERTSSHLRRDAARIREYHRNLLREAARRRRSRGERDVIDSKGAAIARQEQAKLVELRRRATVEVRLALSAVLEVAYEAPGVEVHLVRRRRSIEFFVPWDPFLRAPLPRQCEACGDPTLAFHACEERGHLTCGSCGSPCSGCGRTRCKVCQPGPCCPAGASA